MTLLHPLCPSLPRTMRFLILFLVIPLLVIVAIEENGPICQQAASEDSSNVSIQCDGGKQDNDMNERAQFDALVAWIRSLGGFVDDRIVLRRPDSTSTRGMFVTDKVAKGEKLFFVPNEAIIASEDRVLPSSQCKAAPAMGLAHELALGEESKYAPFVQMLRDKLSGHQGPPCFWSEPARALLDQVLGRHLPPQDYMRYIEQWRPSFGCDPPLSDKDIILYATRVVSSGGIVPLFVFVNHGRSTNYRFGTSKQTGLVSLAAKDIAKGEELLFSYGAWTHVLFRNFGFVEPFPQRWLFDFGVNGQGVDPNMYGRSGGDIVQFELDKVMESGGHNTSVSVTWVNGGGPPSKDVIKLLQSELVRLRTLMSSYGGMNDNDGIPKEEKELILQYHRALKFAISRAIQAATMESTSTSM